MNSDDRAPVPMIFRVILVVIFLSVMPIPFPASGSDLPQEIIHSIHVEGLTRMDEGELIGMIGIVRGNRIDRDTLKKGVKRAFKTGIFSDISVVSDPYENGIRLTYIVQEMPVIRHVRLTGSTHIPARRLRKRIVLQEGDYFREEDMGRVQSELRKYYLYKGFPDASVETLAKMDRGTSEIDVTVTVQEGEPLRIEQISAPDEIKGLLKLSENDIYDREILDGEIKRLKNIYKQKDYLRPEAGPYSYEKGKLVFPFDPGQKLKLSFNGNAVLSTRKLRRETVFMEDEEISDQTIEESVFKLTRRYQRMGYLNVSVASGIESSDTEREVTFYIYEGERVKTGTVEFNGISVAAEALKKIVLLKEGEPYNEEMLENSRDSLSNFYRALGFLTMAVESVEKNYRAEKTEMDIRFNISEGIQTIVQDVAIQGNENITDNVIKNSIPIRRRSPYNLVDISDARFVIKELYNRHGYLDAHIEVRSIVNREEALVIFEVVENVPSVVGKVILRGNIKTKPKIIKREITVREGAPYNEALFLGIKQRLYKLGIFNEVSIESIDTGDIVDGKLVKDVLVTVREGKAGSLEVGLGYGDFEGFRGSFDIRYDNLGGYNRGVGFKTELSEIKKRYVLIFREPWLFNKPNLLLNLFLFREDKESINLDTKEINYRVDRLGIIANVEKEITKTWKANLSYEYSSVETTDVDPGVVLSREDVGTTGIGSITPSIFYDSRDDPFNPTSGSHHGLALKFASAAFLSEVEFVKGTYQGSWYFPVRKGLVFALTIRGGAAYSFDDTKELPLVERFFLGGRTTVRGFENDSLGPKGANNSPTGGNLFVLGNSELRMDIGRGFGVVAFLDSGNVWKLIEDVGTKLRYTAGAGLRYKTPVGPVRIDYGHKLDREPYESQGEVHFSFGHAF
ncbi:MAG: outer membrane protein assembly factor BamA [Nitrospiraceae bacterium]|nr:MAG: outer membrane protein assembly factor BamA [Nitrospiraceae bacterium]